jgi:hypothetical protein
MAAFRLLLACAAFAAIETADAQTVTLTPVADNTLIETPATNSNGAEPYFYVGRTLQFGLRRGLIRFDFSALPANATIQSVSLEVDLGATRGGAIPFGMHRVLASWGEGTARGGGDGGPAGTGDATWLHRSYPTLPWTQPGGDYVPTASATTLLEIASLNPYVWTSTPQLVADVQQWVNSPATNFGWIIVSGRESEARTSKQVLSRENNPPPRLTVQYSVPEPPPSPAARVPLPPATLALGAVALAGIGLRALSRPRPPGAAGNRRGSDPRCRRTDRRSPCRAHTTSS